MHQEVVSGNTHASSEVDNSWANAHCCRLKSTHLLSAGAVLHQAIWLQTILPYLLYVLHVCFISFIEFLICLINILLSLLIHEVGTVLAHQNKKSNE